MSSTKLDDIGIKLSDFGFTTYLDEDQMLEMELGSAIYMAPEIISMQKYNNKVDIWSAGVLIYYLCCGQFPFKAISRDQLFITILSDSVVYTQENWSNLSKECKEFV